MIDDDNRPWWRHRSLGARRRLRLTSGDLTYFETGAGEPLVFLHGLLMNSNIWRKVIGSLSTQYRCIALDLPYGSHATPMPDADLSIPGFARLVAEALEALELRDVTLVGNDGGSSIAQVLATSRPELIARLVLTPGGAYDGSPPKIYRPILALLAHAPAAQQLVLGPLRVRGLRQLPFSYGWLTRRPIEPATSDSWVLPAIMDSAIFTDLQRILRSARTSDVQAAAQRFASFRAPVLVAWSPQDRVFPPAHAERLAADFPNSRLEWIQESCSLLPEDKPFELAKLISDFMKVEVDSHA